MSSRKRYAEEEAERSSKRRKATSDQAEIEARLESLITRVGEKSTSSLESNLEGLAGVLEADLSNYKHKILEILCICAIELPEKVTVYTTLVGLLNTKNYSAGEELVDMLIKQMRDYMKHNEWEKSQRIVRFLSDLINCHVVELSSLLVLYQSFLDASNEEGVPQVRADFFVYAVLSSLPWSGEELSESKGPDLDKLLDRIDKYISLLSNALQHALPPFTPPPHTDECVYPIPRVVFRLFDATDIPEGPALPGSNTINRYLVEDCLSRILQVYLDRKDCAAQLVGFHAKNRFPYHYMIIEVVFSSLFNLPDPANLEVFHASLLLELCKLQPGFLPQVLAQATEMLYERVEHMNLTCMERFIRWFSHHLSNFQFRWSWDEWIDCTEKEPEDAKPVFIHEVLQKCLRLSYHQRLVETLPDKFEPLIPKEPTPVFRYIDEETNQIPALPISRKLIEAFKAKATMEQVEEILNQIPGPKKEDNSGEVEEAANPLKIDVFVQSLLFLGQKSFSHTFSALAKFHPLLKKLGNTEESQIFMLRTIRDLWQNHQQMICVIIDKLIRTTIVSCPAVINWIFSEHMRVHFTEGFVWEILHGVLRKMNMEVTQLQKELEDVKHKKSDEEDGETSGEEYAVSNTASESQVEKLQESYEAAQSEQKNLFLIILQRFIILLTEHIVSCESKGTSFQTPWYNLSIQRLEQIFTLHHKQVSKYTGTLENLLFSSDTDQNLLQVYHRFCSLRA
ncbi:putative nuclear cap-binding protein subunit 1-like [Apostichopus japonicus]|uniref:Putative nuclear cap-binding protein subunit 1-like n=1 Tax=Stichopus japonicus TaxID=307972 RepID=A0A2G8KM06_STIJA|nr:putative nuclear cap-binding protein subunit 1-like [Apostichopus japonicus]